MTLYLRRIEDAEKGDDYVANRNLREREMNLPLDPKSTGDFIRWVMKDVIKEEYDVMQVNGYDTKQLGKMLPTPIRVWYQSNY